jgi:hypothetical protein
MIVCMYIYIYIWVYIYIYGYIYIYMDIYIWIYIYGYIYIWIYIYGYIYIHMDIYIWIYIYIFLEIYIYNLLIYLFYLRFNNMDWIDIWSVLTLVWTLFSGTWTESSNLFKSLWHLASTPTQKTQRVSHAFVPARRWPWPFTTKTGSKLQLPTRCPNPGHPNSFHGILCWHWEQMQQVLWKWPKMAQEGGKLSQNRFNCVDGGQALWNPPPGTKNGLCKIFASHLSWVWCAKCYLQSLPIALAR